MGTCLALEFTGFILSIPLPARERGIVEITLKMCGD
jgi:hypothetical protein